MESLGTAPPVDRQNLIPRLLAHLGLSLLLSLATACASDQSLPVEKPVPSCGVDPPNRVDCVGAPDGGCPIDWCIGCLDAGVGATGLITEACILEGEIPAGSCFRGVHKCDGPEDCPQGQFCYVVLPGFTDSQQDPRYCTTVEVPAGKGDRLAGRICHADCDCPVEHPRCVENFGARLCQP